MEAWNYRELADSLLTLYVTGLEVALNLQSFVKGINNLTTCPSKLI